MACMVHRYSRGDEMTPTQLRRAGWHKTTATGSAYHNAHNPDLWLTNIGGRWVIRDIVTASNIADGTTISETLTNLEKETQQ